MCVSGVGGNNNQVFNSDRVGASDDVGGCGNRSRALANPYGGDRFESNSASSESSEGGGFDDLLSKLAGKGLQVLQNPLNAVSEMLGGLFGGGEGGSKGGPLGGIMNAIGGILKAVSGILGGL